MSTPTLLMALLVFIVTLELTKQGYFRPKPVREVKVKAVMRTELIPILIIGLIPTLGLVVTILVILDI